METTELEQKILSTAEQLFLEKGFAGTSTTDIAKAVGCNQALVHYYYRTKERLFRGIFEQKMHLLLDYLDNTNYDGDIINTLEQVVDWYFIMLGSNPKLPFFVLNELVLNKERREWLRDTFIKNEQRQRVYYTYSNIVRREIEAGHLRPIEPLDLLLNTVSLTVMTFVTLPIYQDLLEKSDDEIKDYLTHRKAEIITMLRNGLK